jgi:hypothetical protein
MRRVESADCSVTYVGGATTPAYSKVRSGGCAPARPLKCWLPYGRRLEILVRWNAKDWIAQV